MYILSYSIDELKQMKFTNGTSSAKWFMGGFKDMLKDEFPQNEYIVFKGTFIIQKFDKWGNPLR